MNGYVTDTHPLIWYFSKQPKLSDKVFNIFEKTELGHNFMYIPVPVLWEISLLLRAGKINLKMPFRYWYEKLLKYNTFIILPLEPGEVVDSYDLLLPDNKDPFDHLIVTSALTLDLPLITLDERIQNSGVVETVW